MIYRTLIDMDNLGMTIQDIRRARLAKLIGENYESQADFVAKTGENQGEVSGLLRKKSWLSRQRSVILLSVSMPTKGCKNVPLQSLHLYRWTLASSRLGMPMTGLSRNVMVRGPWQ
ncbi:MAG: hypothetical protein ABIP80_01060 [Ferruginibacter sp.]